MRVPVRVMAWTPGQPQLEGRELERYVEGDQAERGGEGADGAHHPAPQAEFGELGADGTGHRDRTTGTRTIASGGKRVLSRPARHS